MAIEGIKGRKPVSKFMQNTDDGIKDLYDSERKAVRDIKATMQMRHSFRGVMTIDQEDAIKRTFTHEVQQRCAEIGLIVDVIWEWEKKRCPRCQIDFNTDQVCPRCRGLGDLICSPDVSDKDDDNNIYWNPAVVICGRTDKLIEYDHDKQKHEIQTGLLDGQPGYIREDGTKREDPIRKLIV